MKTFAQPPKSQRPILVEHPNGNLSFGYKTKPGKSGAKDEPQMAPTHDLPYPPNPTLEEIFGPSDTWHQHQSHTDAEDPYAVREIRVEGINSNRNPHRSTSQRIINVASGVLNAIVGGPPQ